MPMSKWIFLCIIGISSLSCQSMSKAKYEKILSDHHGVQIVIDQLDKSFFRPRVNIRAHVQGDDIVFDAYMKKDGSQVQSYLAYAKWASQANEQISQVLDGVRHEKKLTVDFPETTDPKQIPDFAGLKKASASEVKIHAMIYLFEQITGQDENLSMSAVSDVLRYYENSGFAEIYLDVSVLDKNKIDALDDPKYGFNIQSAPFVESNWVNYCQQKLLVVYKPGTDLPSSADLYEFVSMDPHEKQVNYL